MMSNRIQTSVQLVFLLLFLGTASVALAQAKVANPHGTMDISCVVCHTEQYWQVDEELSGFDHSNTGFVLEGLHSHAQCRDCHQEKVFSHVGISCADCHDDFHKGRLGVSCDECHTPYGWVDRSTMQKDHDSTALPLVGAHSKVDCDACHSGPVSSQYVGTVSECIACHQDVYDGTINPIHSEVGFGVDCESCHTVFANSWGRGDYRHPETFPLTGGHGGLECISCHTNGFQAAPLDCIECHQNDYNEADEPDHAGAVFPLDCTVCHTTVTWDGAEYDHSISAFPLTGAHEPLDCLACHSAGYVGTPLECSACHQTDYDEATEPLHTESSFPLDCTVCHTTITWDGAPFNHEVTNFPLTGAHEPLDCLACHSTGYVATPEDCYACHQTDYDEAIDPVHTVDGFPFDCTACHTTITWDGANFNHSNTSFPLTGAHVPLDCSACHSAGYAGTPMDCYACHDSDFNNTNDPAHAAAGFPQDCESCHTTSAWEPSSWDHDILFPIYSGEHRGEWNNCIDCHEVASDYSLFECIHCHEHNNENDLNDDHNNVDNYQYLSTACFGCHPQGDE